MKKLPADMRIPFLQHLYRSGSWTPLDTAEALIARLAEPDTHRAWIHRLSEAELRGYAQALMDRSPDELPLYGIPFAIKDNIDLAGVPTTAACPDFAYTPEHHAFVVQRLIDAGAIPVGKTNLDQFATGLNGTRSPFGACRNAFDPDYISGGSSSGSAVTVALGMASFSLGTDTAGSGRVPASFNNLVGLKPTCGLLSNSGVVPACRSLDSISIFALDADDAEVVLEVAQGFDPADPFSRPGFNDACLGGHFSFGVPRADQLEFFGDTEAAALFTATVEGLKQIGGKAVEIDLGPFLDTARLLYEGPWVAERYAAVGEFIEAHPDAVHPVTRAIILGGKAPSAVDAFRGLYRLRSLQGQIEEVFGEIDVLLTPTAGTIYRIAEMEADPVRLNTQLGYYTNFMNLLDMAAVAMPVGFRDDGLPWGVTVCAPAGSDHALIELARRWLQHRRLPLGATGVSTSAGATRRRQRPCRGGRRPPLRIAAQRPADRAWSASGVGRPHCPHLSPLRPARRQASGPDQGRQRRRRDRMRSVGDARQPVRLLRCWYSRAARHRQADARRRFGGQRLHLRGHRRRRGEGHHRVRRLAGVAGQQVAGRVEKRSAFRQLSCLR
jgi:allophanate hydrolase